jgi:hypothetical protein
VLTADCRFEGWTATDWTRFVSLWKPRATAEREPTRPRGGVFVIHDGARVRKLLHTQSGRLEAPRARWPIPLAEMAGEHHASWAVAAHAGALDEVMERFGARARRSDDLTVQSLLLLQILREMIAEGAIDHWPRRLNIPAPTDVMVKRAVDALCPDGLAICLGMFKDGGLYTSFVARRRGASFDVIAGPDELRPAMGLLSGDWRRDYSHLVRVAEDRYAPLAFGCFAEVDTFRDLQVDARPGAWGRAVVVRDVILGPIPMAVGIALGVDGTRYALEHLKIITSRIEPFGIFEPALRTARERLGAASGGRDLPAVLGFDPMAALRALLKR